MLILPIKKKWYDMIFSGKKKEEYREIKPYYEVRFHKIWGNNLQNNPISKEIIFRNGYSKDSLFFIAKCSIKMGYGKTEWGAEKEKEYYILQINEII